MSRRTITIGSKVGLHARPASIFTHAAKATGLAVRLTDSSGKTVNAASILSVLSLGINCGDSVTLICDDEGAEAALDSLSQLLESELDH